MDHSLESLIFVTYTLLEKKNCQKRPIFLPPPYIAKLFHCVCGTFFLDLLAVFDFLLSRFLSLEVGDSSISVKLESLSSICAELVLTDLLTFSSRYSLVSSSLLNWSRWIPLNFGSITSYHNFYILLDPLFL